METERPHSLRHLLIRIFGSVLALLLLYVLSAGPAAYYIVKKLSQGNGSGASVPILIQIYQPLSKCVADTPLEPPFVAYCLWWTSFVNPNPPSFP